MYHCYCFGCLIAFAYIFGQRRISEVEGLGALSGTKQRSIAGGCCLNDFVFYREKVHLKLTRFRVRVNSDALFFKERVGRTDYAFFVNCERVGQIDDVGNGLLYSVS